MLKKRIGIPALAVAAALIGYGLDIGAGLDPSAWFNSRAMAAVGLDGVFREDGGDGDAASTEQDLGEQHVDCAKDCVIDAETEEVEAAFLDGPVTGEDGTTADEEKLGQGGPLIPVADEIRIDTAVPFDVANPVVAAGPVGDGGGGPVSTVPGVVALGTSPGGAPDTADEDSPDGETPVVPGPSEGPDVEEGGEDDDEADGDGGEETATPTDAAPTEVPAPGALILFGLGLAGLAARRKA